MPVPFAEIKGALHGVPVLSLFKTVAHEDLFVHRGAHHHFWLSAHLRGGKHLVHNDQSPRTFGGIIVYGIEQKPLAAALNDVRIDGKGRHQIAAIAERSLRSFADSRNQPLRMIVRRVRRHTGHVQIILSADLRHSGRPKFLVFLARKAKSRKIPVEFIAADIQLHSVDMRCIHIIFPADPDNVGIGLTAAERHIQFHNILPTSARSARPPERQTAAPDAFAL